MGEEIKVLIFGGCGFIGRYIISELLENNAVCEIKVVDKVPPQMAWLSPRHTKMFADKRITFKSANLINPASCDAAFENTEYDWVINAAAETKNGLEEAVYKEGIVKISSNCLNASAAKRVKIYLEISSGQMTSSEKVAMKEPDDCLPWSTTAKFKFEVEKMLKEKENLNWIVVRPAFVYGPGDRLGLTPRMIVGSIFKHLNSKMKLLWDEKLKMNTVHVTDVAKAIVWLCQRGKTHQVYNLVDDGDSDQGSLTKVIGDIFNIKYEFCGRTISKIAMIDRSSVVQEVNEKNLEPWARMCSAKGLYNTPLTPYIDGEALSNRHTHIDGTKIRNEGFKFSVPRPDKITMLQVLDEFIEMKLLPGDIYSSSIKEII